LSSLILLLNDRSPHWRDCHLDVVRLLIERGCCVNTVNNSGWTPLSLAARYGDAELFTTLLRSGADTNCPPTSTWAYCQKTHLQRFHTFIQEWFSSFLFLNCRWLVVDSSSIWQCKSRRFRTFQSKSLFFQRRVWSIITHHTLLFTSSHNSYFSDSRVAKQHILQNPMALLFLLRSLIVNCHVDFKRDFQERPIHFWSTTRKMVVHRWLFMLLAMVPLKLSSTNQPIQQLQNISLS
jgi:hypothetical protein